jgi:hypothetical protein
MPFHACLVLREDFFFAARGWGCMLSWAFEIMNCNPFCTRKAAIELMINLRTIFIKGILTHRKTKFMPPRAKARFDIERNS